MFLRIPSTLLVCASLLLATACPPEKPRDDTGTPIDADGDGFEVAVDCDDTDPTAFPGAPEVCDGVDNDCDGEVDDGVGDAWYPDADGDGWGDPAGEVLACSQPGGFVGVADDCDDADPEVYPGAPERCNSVDDDCDGEVDDDPTEVWYSDVDSDGYGNPSFAVNSCDPGAGWVDDDSDCDDTDPAIHPRAEEVCNGVDDDCDGGTDEALDETWYADTDGDGYGDAGSTRRDCAPASGWVADATDCADADAAIHPGAGELCDGVDNDCDGDVDDADPDVADQATWYRDADGDGFGLDTDAVAACLQPTGYTALGGDCDDADSAYHPGAAETDCADPNDYNCDGSVGYADADGDGFPACEDCDDREATTFPGAAEVCDGVDNDCSGTIDEPYAVDAPTWYADADGDGWGDAANTAVACTAPAGFVADATDCDDGDGTVHPGAAEICNLLDDDCDGDVDDADADVTGQATWYADADGDGWGDAASPLLACFQPSTHVTDATDCDDTSAAVNPAATETCNGIDDDCSGRADEPYSADAPTWYADTDADGFGDAAVSSVACTQPSGFVADATDCDDHDDDIHPAAAEVCDAVDDDCDGATDEDDALDASTWYADADGDGYGDPAVVAVACYQPSGFLVDATDCDDTDPAVSPAGVEICDGLDNDCDAQIDDADASVMGTATWYADADGDGFGAAGYPFDACVLPTGYVADATDCDDLHASTHPGADEYCDGADDDCDGVIDEDDAVDAVTWYADADADGYGDAASTAVACYQPVGFVAWSSETDCDDSSGAVHPGAVETCNGIDDDCTGSIDEPYSADAATWYADADGDGYGDAGSSTVACYAPAGYLADATDCDDTSAAVHPAATEICNRVDDDCDGAVDDDDLSVTGQTTWYADADADGFGDAAASAVTCYQPMGYVTSSTDCDDGAAAIHPGATEICNSLDDDCDTLTDDADPDVTGRQTWYADADSDGFGDAATTAFTCFTPAGYVAYARATDCDDTSAITYPGADERCDGDDNDCDGTIDELGAVDGDTIFADADGDTWGDPATATTACALPTGYVETDGDCDDADDGIYPYAGDSYGDYLDGDCDGYDSEAAWYGTETYFALIPDDSWSWADARTACQAMGYDDLASVQDRSEMGTLYAMAGASGLGASYNFYIGFNDIAAEGSFVWSDGLGGVYTNWDWGEPNDLWGEDCVHFYGTSGLWNDGSCTTVRWPFTCEVRLSDVSRTDDDGDGVTEADGDCDDADPTSYPGAAELCDGIDNDCDEDIDEDVTVWYPDDDGDGYGDAGTSTTSCAAPTGYVADATDCDDTRASVNPGAAEVAGNGVDDDCDGLVDESAALLVDGTVMTLSAGSYVFDRVEILRGGTLFLEDQVVIETNDFTVDSASAVDGDEAGEAGGASRTVGAGSGGGGTSSNAGAGGGGYGGAGGMGGYDSGDSPGAGGPTYGGSTSMSIQVGSGGGGGGGVSGGAGGGALEVYAASIDIAGTITVTGGAGSMTTGYGQGSGGGSGGGLLLVGGDISVSGLLDASGGPGGDGTSSANDGGGGGGGGRVKVFYSNGLSFAGTCDVSGGDGGIYGTVAYGEDGDDGTCYESTF